MLNCGHSEGCMYRYRHKGITHKYCMACICEKSGVGEIGNNPDFKSAEERFQERKKLKEEEAAKALNKPSTTKKKKTNKKK